MQCSADCDAWAAVLNPPAHETPAQKDLRIARQQDAARISSDIDAAIERSRKLFDRRNKAIKVLLLGQAESGKSTMLRNFQLAFSPSYFLRDIPVWKIIIQLNLIGSVKRLLAIIEHELDSQSPRSHRPRRKSAPPPLSTSPTPAFAPSDPPLTQAHSALRLRLLPLLSVETNLAHQLLPESSHPSSLASSSGWTKWASGGGHESANPLFANAEICVRAGGAWKSILERVTGAPRSPSDPTTKIPSPHNDDPLAQPIDPRPSSSHSGKHAVRNTRPHPSDPTPLLEALASDINALWTDPAVQALLKRKGLCMEHTPGFFLNDVSRIGKPGWRPAIDDILRARLRTFGVEEHRFLTDNGSEWYIYDVGGSRGSRNHWVPYFDDVQAIIFLAPLAFNQVLDEDRTINRVEDSISLWKQICSNTLVARANIILFLNKMDILASTLKAGVRLQTYVSSFGSQPNEVENVVEYFRHKFHAYHKRLSPRPRTFFCHETSAIDTKATQVVLAGVRDSILRSHLEKLSII